MAVLGWGVGVQPVEAGRGWGVPKGSLTPLRPPPREHLPSHFKFKEYCPQVFRNLRERFGIDDQDYQVASAPTPGVPLPSPTPPNPPQPPPAITSPPAPPRCL